MTRTTALAGIVALALGRPGPTVEQRRPIDLEASDCSSINYMFGDFQVARATEHTTIPVSAGPLDVRPDGNGGVRIEHGPGGVYGITACIGAGAASAAGAQAAADSIHLDVSGARVRLRDDGASRATHDWSVQLVVTAPDGAAITAQTSNGPLGVRGVTGTLDLRASNGPISIVDAGGDVRAQADNGPIDVRGSGGEIDIRTSNGPIGVHLDGRRWDGHLTARASNGPLDVFVPPDFQSGVEVRSSAHSPWTCRAAACSSRGGRDWDDRSRTFRLGADPVVVQVSTVNGPVTVSDGR
jgi:hypothetical protein